MVLPDDATLGRRDVVLKALVAGAATATFVEPETVPGATTKGSKRGARFLYRSGSTVGSGLSEGVFLELGSVGGAMPFEQRTVTSLIASVVGDLIAGTVEAEPVAVRVLDPSRTLVEKLVLLHTAHSAAEPAQAVRGARHFYDVHRLLGRPAVLERLVSVDVSVLARDVCTYSALAGRPAVPRPAGGFSASPAFGGGPHLAAARAEYDDRVLRQLLWPQAFRPSFDDCAAAVHRHAHLL